VVADQTFRTVAAIYSAGVRVANAHNPVHVDLVDLKTIIANLDYSTMVVPAVSQLYRDIVGKTDVFQLMSGFQRVGVGRWQKPEWEAVATTNNIETTKVTFLMFFSSTVKLLSRSR
jgi:hypothetical protein